MHNKSIFLYYMQSIILFTFNKIKILYTLEEFVKNNNFILLYPNRKSLKFM